MSIWNILWRLGLFNDHSVHFVFMWYIFYRFGIMHQEKSGNSAVVTGSVGAYAPNLRVGLSLHLQEFKKLPSGSSPTIASYNASAVKKLQLRDQRSAF
jgi:hypothetical protein